MTLPARSSTPLGMLRASAATAHESGLLALELTALAESCLPAIAEGCLSEVHDLAASVLARAEERGWVGLVTLAPAVAYLGWFDYWRGNLRAARRNAAEIGAMIEAGHATPSWPSMLAGLEGLILAAKGDTSDAVALA